MKCHGSVSSEVWTHKKPDLMYTKYKPPSRWQADSMGDIGFFLASWWILEEPASCRGGNWPELEKLGGGWAGRREAITSSTSAVQHLNSLSVFKHTKFIYTHTPHSWQCFKPIFNESMVKERCRFLLYMASKPVSSSYIPYLQLCNSTFMQVWDFCQVQELIKLSV